jgi:hypothetical protein
VIIRILGEGQFSVPESALDEINRLDRELEHALGTVEPDFRDKLDALLDKVRSVGTALADDELVESDAILPFADSSEDDIRDMLDQDGLIPG